MVKPRVEAADRDERERLLATLPPPGTPLTGGGGMLPRFHGSQVAPQTVVVVVVTTLLIAAALYLLWELQEIVRWLLIALFLAVALDPVVSWLVARRVPRALAALVAFAGVALLFVGLGILLVPPVVEQVQELMQFVTLQAQQPGGVTQGLEDLANRYGASGFVDVLGEQLSSLPARLAMATGPLLTITRGIIGSITALISIMLLTFFLLKDGDRFVTAALALFHPLQRPRLRRILGQSADAVHGYVNGNLTISVIAGVAAFAALRVLSLPYAVALALVIALFDLIPLVGSTIGAVIVVLIALFIDPVKAGILLVFFLLYQQVENNILQPLVYGRSVKLHPLAVFIAVLAGGSLLGILGALVAIPVAEIIRILAAEWIAGRAVETRGTPHGAREDVPIEQVAADAVGPRVS